jgi:hypothetical protein
LESPLRSFAKRLTEALLLGVADELGEKKYKSSIVADKLGRLLEDKDIYMRCKKIADKLKKIDPLTDICRMIGNQMKKETTEKGV